MTPAQAKELLPVLAAYAEGRVVQWRDCSNNVWRDFNGVDDDQSEPCLAQTTDLITLYEWRVKPSPRDWWLCPSCLHGYNYPEREHLGTFQCGRCSVNVVRVREVVA